MFINMQKTLDISNPTAQKMAAFCLYQAIQKEFGLYPGRISKAVIERSEKELCGPIDLMERVTVISKEVFETRTQEVVNLVGGKTVRIRVYQGLHRELELALNLEKPESLANELIRDTRMAEMEPLDAAIQMQTFGRQILDETMKKSMDIVRKKISGSA